jgi:hypothetical protein
MDSRRQKQFPEDNKQRHLVTSIPGILVSRPLDGRGGAPTHDTRIDCWAVVGCQRPWASGPPNNPSAGVRGFFPFSRSPPVFGEVTLFGVDSQSQESTNKELTSPEPSDREEDRKEKSLALVRSLIDKRERGPGRELSSEVSFSFVGRQHSRPESAEGPLALNNL